MRVDDLSGCFLVCILCLCPDAYYSGWFYTLALRVVAFYIVLMDWCHVIKAQGGCITYEHDDDDDDTYIHTY